MARAETAALKLRRRQPKRRPKRSATKTQRAQTYCQSQKLVEEPPDVKRALSHCVSGFHVPAIEGLRQRAAVSSWQTVRPEVGRQLAPRHGDRRIVLPSGVKMVLPMIHGNQELLVPRAVLVRAAELILIQVQEEHGFVPNLHDLSTTIAMSTLAVLENTLRIARAAVLRLLLVVVFLR